jgi:acyl carrier protein
MADRSEGSERAVLITPELHRQIVAIFLETFQIEPGLALEDFKRGGNGTWDSINHLRLITEIEETFRIVLSDEEVASITSLRDIETLLTRHTPSRNSL